MRWFIGLVTRLRLEREQIRQILLVLEKLTSDTSFSLEKLFLKRAERDFRVERRPYSDKIAMSLRAASQILNKTKSFFESLKYSSVENVNNKFSLAVRKEILSSQYDSSIVFWRKNRCHSHVPAIGTLTLKSLDLSNTTQ